MLGLFLIHLILKTKHHDTVTIESLHQLFLKHNTICTDSRTLKNGDIFFALKGENFNGNTFAEKAIKLGASYAIIDEKKYNTSSKFILVNNVLETLQQLALFHRSHLNTPIISLTGSNGKTTTKELINAVLSKKYKTTATIGNLNNHIGVPLTLLSITKNTEIGIIEMGANHQKEIEFLCKITQPDYGYITNFGKAHLEGFGCIEGIIKGKSELYNYLIENNKTIFINNNDPIQVEKTKQAKIYSFGSLSKNITIDFINASPFATVNFNGLEIKSQLIGNYNFNNIAAAITIGTYFKVNPEAIKSAIESYKPTNNRSQIITKNSNKIILDAYNANPTSMEAALLNLNKQTGHKIAILGDMFELGNDALKEHQSIVNLSTSLNLDRIILIGDHFKQTHNISKKIEQHKTFDNFKQNSNLSEIKNTTFLIKGSRGMALERILNLF